MTADKKDDSSSGASEDVKRKFREALDKKKAQNARKGEAHLDGESVVHETHGPADMKREFRRKSG